MCCVPQAFQGPIKMEKLEYTVERCAQYVRVSGAETFVEDLAAFVPRQRARDVAKNPQPRALSILIILRRTLFSPQTSFASSHKTRKKTRQRASKEP